MILRLDRLFKRGLKAFFGLKNFSRLGLWIGCRIVLVVHSEIELLFDLPRLCRGHESAFLTAPAKRLGQLGKLGLLLLNSKCALG